jgi:predicted RNA-binding protein
MIQSLVDRLGYQIIINHSGIDLSPINGDFELIDTRQGSTAGSSEALDRLESTISDVVKRLEIRGPKGHRHRLEIYRSTSRFLFGTDSWLSDVKIEGRPPRWRIEKEGIQIAQWHPRAGRFAFSKSSLKILYDQNVLPRIHLLPDVEWKGDIFVSILESYPDGIREGDDLLVIQNGDLIGSARAVAAGWEWKGSPGRVARSHHRIG